MNNSNPTSTGRTIDIVNQGLARRYRAERRFRLYGLTAIILSLVFLSLLFINIFGKGYTAFRQTFIKLDVFFSPEIFTNATKANADYGGLVKQILRSTFPEAKSRTDKRLLYRLVSSGAAYQLRDMVLKNPDLIGRTVSVWVAAGDDVDMLIKGHLKETFKAAA